MEEALLHFKSWKDSDTVGDTGEIGYLRKKVEKLYELGTVLVQASAEDGIIRVHLPLNISATVAVVIANMRADEIHELESKHKDQSVIELWWD